MLFGKKQKLRKIENARLFQHLEEQKRKLDSEKQLIERSIDPSEEVLYRIKVTEVIYSFLLREARERRASMNELH
ncbi:YaaL family protein [Halalkalibacter kiskunsagensis]|uniref:YaaL family protein n=1 Tax=Halalkalibacter kiskunsagensis TaxID=1548599 RepID=A0ABV6KAK5_9BACI